MDTALFRRSVLKVTATGSDFEIREATDADIEAIVQLAGEALGWDADQPNVELFRWKHFDNPAGRSAMWVAERDGQLIGFRSFLRWKMVTELGQAPIEVVRAVDTATHPDARRIGVFAALTSHGLAQLSDQGVSFVFNTPNDQSRPGYLSMGWQVAGKVEVQAKIRRPRRLKGAKVPADRWSVSTRAGTAIEAVISELVGLGSPEIHTHRSVEYLTWRYGFEPLGYRGYHHRDGVAVFRLRRRGGALECTVCEFAGGRKLLRDLLWHTEADYLLTTRFRGARAVPVPFGPTLVTRDLASAAPTSVGDFSFDLGDIELF